MTLISDSMAKHISGIRNTVVQAFPGVNIMQMQQIIKAKRLVSIINIPYFWLVPTISILLGQLVKL